MKCWGSPRTSQIPWSGSRQCFERACHLALDDRPQPVGELVARAGVQVDRVEHGAPHVVLALAVGAVADAHRLRAAVAGEMVELLLLQATLAADPVHDLQLPLLGLGEVGDEIEEIVGLPVEAEGVERPQHERGVADPGVAVVPVAFATKRLRQRGRGRRHHRPSGGVAQPLERQRAALQVRAPGMVGEGALLEPLLPVMGSAHESLVGLHTGRGQRVLGPAQCSESGLPFTQDRARAGARALEPEVHVGDQLELEVHALRAGRRLVVTGAGVGPFGGEAAVVEDRFAVEVDLGPPLHAEDRPQQHVVGVVVGGGAPVSTRALLVVVPGPDAQHVADHHPPCARLPAGLQHQCARQVAHRAGHGHAGRPQSKAASVAVEHRAEHARRV